MAHDIEDLIFFEFFTFHELFEIAIFAELGDYVQTVFGAENIFEFYDVGVVEPL